MELLLTSFGEGDESHAVVTNPFYRMPPTMLALRGRYLQPDYAALLLADAVVLDEASYDRLLHRRHWSYNIVAKTVRTLEAEGFIRLTNYGQLIGDQEETIKADVEHELNSIREWLPILAVAVERWSAFVELTRMQSPALFLSDGDFSVRAALAHVSKIAQVTKDAQATKDTPDLYIRSWPRQTPQLVDVLRAYLTYVHRNIALSRQLRIPFYDWYDYQPFYERKLRGSGKRLHDQMDDIRKLFEVSFPEFAVRSPRQLIKILTDRRIVELRELVASATRGDVQFDSDFAKRILFEVLAREQSINRYRSILSYALLPLGFIPRFGTPLQKAAEEAIARPYEHTQRSVISWFYLLSEAREGENTSTV